MGLLKFILLPTVFFAGCETAQSSSNKPEVSTQLQEIAPFRTEGAYYREEQGKYVISCSTYSIPPTTFPSYAEKFAFRKKPNEQIEVLHFDAKCSDMLFPSMVLSQAEVVNQFSFSADGLTMKTAKSIRGSDANFKWFPEDPK